MYVLFVCCALQKSFICFRLKKQSSMQIHFNPFTIYHVCYFFCMFHHLFDVVCPLAYSVFSVFFFFLFPIINSSTPCSQCFKVYWIQVAQVKCLSLPLMCCLGVPVPLHNSFLLTGPVFVSVQQLVSLCFFMPRFLKISRYSLFCFL